MTKGLNFQCALITGAAGGIGRGMAESFIARGKKVILCGRTESKLQETSKALNNSPYYVVDVGDLENLPHFIERVTKDHPDLDCLVNNAGVQRPLYMNDMKADEFLPKADNEISINVSGPMHLTMLLLPHLKSKQDAVIMNVSSILAFVPFVVINPVYCATKAWLHFWTMNLRTQLKQAGSNIKVIEIAPPTVTTELHRERDDPFDNTKEKNPAALSVEEYQAEVDKFLDEGCDTIGAGVGVGFAKRWYDEFAGTYESWGGYVGKVGS